MWCFCADVLWSKLPGKSSSTATPWLRKCYQGLENAIFRPWRTENKELRSLFSVHICSYRASRLWDNKLLRPVGTWATTAWFSERLDGWDTAHAVGSGSCMLELQPASHLAGWYRPTAYGPTNWPVVWGHRSKSVGLYACIFGKVSLFS